MPASSAGSAMLVRHVVGRTAELAVLARQFDAGQGQAVLVRGAAGMGATTLVTAALAAIRHDQATVLSTSCDSTDSTVPYGAVRRLFASIDLGPGSPMLLGHAADAVPALLGRQEDPATLKVLEGLNGLARNVMGGFRLVLAVDDVQWCDEQSLSWLGFLIRRARTLPVLVLLTQRTGTRPPAEMVVLPNCRVLDLGPLPGHGVAELITEIMAAEPTQRFTRLCAEITGGHPGLLVRLLTDLRATGTEPDDQGAAKIMAVARPIVTGSVLDSLRRMTPEAQAVARALAVLGHEDDELVAALARVSGQVMALAVQQLRDEWMLAPMATGFRHDLVRDALIETFQPERLTALRRDAAMLRNDLGSSAEAIADMLLPLPALSEPWMVGVLRDAAANAGTRGERTTSTQYLARALEIDQTSTPVRVDMARTLARTDPIAAIGYLEEALAVVTDPRRFAPIASELAIACVAVGRSHRAAAVLTRLAREPRADEEILASQWLAGAVAVAGTLAGRPSDRLADQVRPFATTDMFFGDWPQFGPIVTLCLADRLACAHHALARILRESKQRGLEWAYASAIGVRAFIQYWSGSLSEAMEDTQAAIEATTDVDAAATLPRIVQAAIWVRRQDPAKAQHTLAAIDLATIADRPLDYHLLLQTQARIQQSIGDIPSALTLLRRSGDIQAANGIANPVLSSWWLDSACLLAQLGRHNEGMALVRQAETQVERWGTVRGHGMLLLARGVSTPNEQALSLLADAVSTLADTPARLEHARAAHELGRAMMRHGNAKDARKHLRRAIDLAALGGDLLMVAEARRSLTAAGGRMRTTGTSPLGILTTGERRVVELAAAGQTNQAIARELFLTVRTVEVHLSKAYRKLGVSGRGELASALRPKSALPSMAGRGTCW